MPHKLREIAMKYWFVLLLLAAPVFAEPSTDDPDAPFYMKATRAGLAEVDGGMLAQQRSKNPQVLAFAAMVAKDHNAANAQLRELAVANHVDLPIALTAEQLAKKAQLSSLTGDDFDRSYIEWQILAHKDAIELFRQESETGDDKDALASGEAVCDAGNRAARGLSAGFGTSGQPGAIGLSVGGLEMRHLIGMCL
jgi:putative membrane protein